LPTYVSTVTGGIQAGSLTLSSVVSTGTDRILVLGVATRGTPSVTSVVFNTSENFTEQGTIQIGNATVHLYTLVNPTATTASVVITNSNSLRMAAAVSLYTNVDQTTPVRAGTVQTASGTGTAPAVSVTGTSGDLLVDACSIVQNGPPTLTAAHTERANITQTGGSTDVGLGCQELSATGGSDSMSWTASSSTDWAIAALSLISASGGGGPTAISIFRRRIEGY